MIKQILLAVQYKRQNGLPIDVDQVFQTSSARTAYLTNPRRYAGQIVSDLETESIYFLNAAKNAWIDTAQIPPEYATETTMGEVELATPEEALEGIDPLRVITPATLKLVIESSTTTVPDATETVKGKTRYATDAETITGAEDEAAVTPKGAKAASDALEARVINNAIAMAIALG